MNRFLRILKYLASLVLSTIAFFIPKQTLRLITPALTKNKRSFTTKGKLKMFVLLLGGIAIALTVYFSLLWFLNHVARAAILGDTLGPIIGRMLVSKLLEMLLLTMMFMVLFSSLVAAISSLFIDEELTVLMTSPQNITTIFRSRFLIMTFESSWMVIAFFMPALLAFATTLQSSLLSCMIFQFFLLLFILLPNIAGAFVAIILANFIPIRQMKKVFQFLSIIVLTTMIFFIRSLEAEKLLNPSYFSDISQYLLGLQMPLVQYSPSFWMHNASMSLFRGDISGAFIQIFPLLIFILGSFVILNFVAKNTYRKSWQISMEAIENQVLGLEWIRSILIWPLRFFSPPVRVIASKEITLFLRDPSIFSQLFMMGAIIFIYGYNLSILPLEHLPSLYSGEVNDSLVFFNGPFIGFILASVGMRFVYPSISMEGRAFWAVKSSPLKAGKILMIKYLLYLIPMIILGIVLSTVTTSIFEVSHPSLMYLSIINVTIIAIVVTGLAVTSGTIYADFSVDSPIKIAGSYGGFVYMLLSALFVVKLILLQLYPLVRVFLNLRYILPSLSNYSIIVISAILIVISMALWLYLPFKRGLEAIENYEPQ